MKHRSSLSPKTAAKMSTVSRSSLVMLSMSLARRSKAIRVPALPAPAEETTKMGEVLEINKSLVSNEFGLMVRSYVVGPRKRL